jgi:hypothetical protein
MKVVDYVFEAAAALGAPAEVWSFRNSFNYDWSCQEWCFSGPSAKGPKALADMREWVERICGWLQSQYPTGPGS